MRRSPPLSSPLLLSTSFPLPLHSSLYPYSSRLLPILCHAHTLFPFHLTHPSLARNFSTQLKSAFNLDGELPALSSNVASHQQHILSQRQELHRIEAELEEAEEALARRGLAPDLSAAMNAQGAGAGPAGQGQSHGGAGAGTAAAAVGAGAALGLNETDSQRMARDVYAEGDYEGDAGIRRLGGEGFSMREADMQHGSSGSYGAGYGQQPSALYAGNESQGIAQSGLGQGATVVAAAGAGAGAGIAVGAYAAGQGDRQRRMGEIYDEHRAGGSTQPQPQPQLQSQESYESGPQSHGIDQRQPQGTTTMSERLLHEQNEDEPVEPKATGYQQAEFSKPIKGVDDVDATQSQGHTGSAHFSSAAQSQGHTGSAPFGSAHSVSAGSASQPTSVQSGGYQVNPNSTQVPYNP